MYTGTEIQTPQDAVAYAEELYVNARKEMNKRLESAEVAIDKWFETRKKGDRAKACNAWRMYLNAKSNEHYMKGYLQGVRDMMDAISH